MRVFCFFSHCVVVKRAIRWIQHIKLEEGELDKRVAAITIYEAEDLAANQEKAGGRVGTPEPRNSGESYCPMQKPEPEELALKLSNLFDPPTKKESFF